MFNIRNCLIALVGINRNLLTRSIHVNILSLGLKFSDVNARYSNAVYKRFYCDTTIDEKNITSADLRSHRQELDKKKLDELLSDSENYKRFQILELEVDVLRHNAERVPKNIEPRDWLVLLNARVKVKRKKYLEFLWRNEKKAENVKVKKELKRAERLAKIEQDSTEDTGEMKYGLLNNTLFLRIYETTMNHFYNGRLIQNMMFEPNIVFDCGYEDHMTKREIHNCSKQLSLAFAHNRTHVNPLCLYFCNFNKNGLLKQYLHQNMPNLMQDDFPAIITPQSYLDLFPKNQLVYLTPHCRTNLSKYDPNMVYIIGALVDKGNSQPLSLAKAKKEGIQMAKFPIDQYLEWGASSSKSLTLNQSIDIMLDLRHTGDWKKALENVPVRKLKSFRERTLQSKMQKSIFLNRLQSQESITQDFTFQNRKQN
ncbi:PREDICTED: mitochondrial ribonuclease P protein 1 homolog [Cyphomyrmex costatus]|uniref:RNA (guanine-9-)-methyltransferase domain-containing protein 1 n=1 Tax=Cyphomyrmex costatus TaxID=456900 RepID=A0A195CTN3_9HYME|nr:PREDICTED: mitochondrial ribonuclease P protein 1 homolog [Cyphomyrmex costatus]KYN04051.1 Mitochondrial ribonuclease P protein 1 like protein [Cyphomyrmex costatus]